MRDFRAYVKQQILSVAHLADVEGLILEVFRYQAMQNEVYSRYIQLLGVRPELVHNLSEIPFLPIRFFKSHEVICSGLAPEKIFLSSGTTKQQRSRHLVADIGFYDQVSLKIFGQFFKDVENPVLLTLLPTYSENPHSSLLHMIHHFQQQFGCSGEQYLSHQFSELAKAIEQFTSQGRNVVLWGVTYALLDFAMALSVQFPGLTIVETGGMKGTRKEMTKAEVHHILWQKFKPRAVVSEFGMGEMLSQAYAMQDGIFHTSWWMSVLVRQVNDPFSVSSMQGRGALNIIDLANIDSCCFVETEDLGEILAGNSFRIAGRMEHAEIRGCNLMWIA